jgi:hypothetical protein
MSEVVRNFSQKKNVEKKRSRSADRLRRPVRLDQVLQALKSSADLKDNLPVNVEFGLKDNLPF